MDKNCDQYIEEYEVCYVSCYFLLHRTAADFDGIYSVRVNLKHYPALYQLHAYENTKNLDASACR